MLTLMLCLCLIAALERRRRTAAKKSTDDIHRFMEWDAYDKVNP